MSPRPIISPQRSKKLQITAKFGSLRQSFSDAAAILIDMLIILFGMPRCFGSNYNRNTKHFRSNFRSRLCSLMLTCKLFRYFFFLQKSKLTDILRHTSIHLFLKATYQLRTKLIRINKLKKIVRQYYHKNRDRLPTIFSYHLNFLRVLINLYTLITYVNKDKSADDNWTLFSF